MDVRCLPHQFHLLLQDVCSAAPVQDLSEQIPQARISLLVLYLAWESWDSEKDISSLKTKAAIPQQQLEVSQQQLPL